jgi:hypothetical protein
MKKIFTALIGLMMMAGGSAMATPILVDVPYVFENGKSIEDLTDKVYSDPAVVQICVSGYKYLVLFGPKRKNDYEQDDTTRQMAIVQMFEQKGNGSVPSKCQ